MARQSRHEERKGNTLRSYGRAGAERCKRNAGTVEAGRGEFRADEES